MKKRGQVTLFVVIGIVVLIIAGLIIYFVNRNAREQLSGNEIDTKVLSPIKSYVEQCIHQTAKDALVKMGQQGRLYSDVNLVSDKNSIAFFYYKGQGFFPTSMTTMEEDVSRYIKENLGSCTGNYDFITYDIEDDFAKMMVSTNFNQDKMEIDVFFPITVSVGNTETAITDFNAEVDISYPGIYEVSREIYKRTKSDPEWVDVDYLSSVPYKVRLLKVSEDTIIYELTDDDGLDDVAYVYRFAVKYTL
ncbi:hypothetical protein JXC34_03800 [Candidatus Woesearchaeota archaeon]|nr:hypothetical protein [Candidatus Woesearchaeota archaeon]